jgi:hypothetical protein
MAPEHLSAKLQNKLKSRANPSTGIAKNTNVINRIVIPASGNSHHASFASGTCADTAKGQESL